MDLKALVTTIDKNRGLLLDFLRIYTGVFLFAKGISFIGDIGSLLKTIDASNVPAGSVALAHLVAFAHLAGGFLLAIGLLTRLAAGVQIPVVLGAVLFVHGKEGFFAPNQSLELALLVLAVLVILTVAGGGPLSLDRYASRHSLEDEPHAHGV